MKEQCFKCGSELTKDPEQVTQGYAAACLNCDEDMYEIEIVKGDKKMIEQNKSFEFRMFQCASEAFLSEMVPVDFEDWEDEERDAFLIEHYVAGNGYEEPRAGDIYEQIEAQALCQMDYINLYYRETTDWLTIRWHVDDVLEVRPDLTKEQAKAVLQNLDSGHDACVGINWDVIQDTAWCLYPESE